MATLRIDIWSDVACPWCYVGKRRLERALIEFSHSAEVKITWHSFELDPSAPREQQDGTYAERLARKYRVSTREAEAMIDRIVAVGKGEGLEFDFGIIRPGNTFDAHRLLHWASSCELQGALKERLLRAYFCEGQAISDREMLIGLSAEVGLDVAETRSVLEQDLYARDVRADEADARSLGINGVPFFVIAEQLGVSGAQPPEVMSEALEKGWEALVQSASELAEGAACGPEGC